MKINSGTFYVITESDQLRGGSSEYFKLGLIKKGVAQDGEGRTTLDRAGEHQTGNPRELTIVAEIQSPAVTELESSMHSLFAPRRVLGEWFLLRPDDVELVIKTANRLAAEQSENLRVAETVKELDQQESVGEKLKANDAMIEFWERWDDSRLAHEAVTSAVKQLDQLFRSLVERKTDLSRVATASVRESVSLEKDRLQAEHPELFAAYVMSQETLAGRTLPRKSAKIFDIDAHDADLAQALHRVAPVVASIEREPDSVALAHELHLKLLQYARVYDWQKRFAVLNLQALCGTAPGIEDLITWNRTRKLEEKFDEKRFKSENADVAAAFSVTKVERRFVTEPMRNYPFTVPADGSDLRPVSLLLGD